jgi:hypothetical protein
MLYRIVKMQLQWFRKLKSSIILMRSNIQLLTDQTVVSFGYVVGTAPKQYI